jgi:hypothetical protein
VTDGGGGTATSRAGSGGGGGGGGGGACCCVGFGVIPGSVGSTEPGGVGALFGSVCRSGPDGAERPVGDVASSTGGKGQRGAAGGVGGAGGASGVSGAGVTSVGGTPVGVGDVVGSGCGGSSAPDDSGGKPVGSVSSVMWVLLRRDGVRRASLPGGNNACARGRGGHVTGPDTVSVPARGGPCTGEGARRGSVSAACHAE